MKILIGKSGVWLMWGYGILSVVVEDPTILGLIPLVIRKSRRSGEKKRIFYILYADSLLQMIPAVGARPG